MLSKILNNLLRPNYAIGYFLGNSFPNYFRNRYVTKTKKFGINKKYFIMSFDCDTDKDIEVVREVDSKLRKLGISATYAVPGELLKRGKDEYTSIKHLGSEFINHGYLSHTEFDEKNKNYVSTLFYDRLPREKVRDDVFNGHYNFIDIFGEEPIGFRTPHFGTFQKTSELNFLYSILKEKNYIYSSSTTPVSGMWHGAVINTESGILEIPVSGSYDFPARILDSWSYRFSPTRKLNEKDYFNQFTKMVSFMNDSSSSGILNIYADPSQVYDWQLFFDCMEIASSLENTSFQNLVKNYE